MKRTLSLLLVVAMLLSITVVPVFAETTTQQEENVTPMTDTCPCGCGKTIEEIEWTPLPTGYMGSIPEGHHYLTQDYVQSTYGMTIIAGTKVVIDLRGYTWTSKDTKNRILTIQGDMWLMDTVGDGKLAPKLEDNNTGGAILLDTYELPYPSFTLVSGTLTAGAGSGQTNSGGFVYAREDSKFIMLGGVIENVSTKSYGGAIYAANTASIEIKGGIIRNCSAGIRGGAIYSASTTDMVIKNTTFINNTVNYDPKDTERYGEDHKEDSNPGGGAVYCLSSKLTVENCTFMNNSCPTNGGGAIHTAKGLEMKDSLFIGNSAVNGGDLYLRGSAASTIDGCKFYGGSSKYNADGGGGNGGSIHASDTNLTIKDSLMMGAIADKQGGHIYQYGGNLTIENSTLNGGVSNWTGKEGNIPYCGGGNLIVMTGKTTTATTTIKDSVIRNGFAMARGGNIQLCTDTTVFTMTNTTVTGGVAKYRGNNIEAQASMKITIDGGTIDGDVALTPGSKPITLKGELKIGLRNNGLAVGANANIDASGLTEEAEIYISGTGNLVAAGANAKCFLGAIRTTLSVGEDGAIVGTTAEDGQLGGYCPHCKTPVVWTAYAGEVTSGHYYLTTNVSADTNYSYNGVEVVLDLNGKTITDTSDRALTTRIVAGACALSILDSAGNGVVQSNGPGTTSNGGILLNNGTANIYGGTFKNTEASAAKQGGLIYNLGTLNIYGGFFDGSNYENTTASAGLGGAISNAASTTLKITAGHFVGGKAYQGGGLYLAENGTITISGGTFVGGTATNSGGSIYISDSTAGTINIENTVVRGGKATLNGGNLRAGKAPTYTVEKCYIAEGSVTGSGSYGGNISLNTSGTFADCVIYDGQSAGAGGNVYAAGTASTSIFDGCLITGGTATSNGGNVMFNHGYHQILGGEVSYGTANDKGGNIYTNAGNYNNRPKDKVVIDKNSKGEVPQIFNGTATDEGGNLYIIGVVELSSATIFGGAAGSKGQDIMLATGAVQTKLTVGNGVTGGRTGAISMNAAVPDPIYGEAVLNTVCDGLNENTNIILEGVVGEPNILAKGGILRVGGAKVVDADGKEKWYVDYAAAEAACGGDEYVKLYADTALTLTKNTYVDLNGKTVTITDGEEYLLGMDSTGDSYTEPIGKVTFTGTSPVADKSMVYAPNGNKYVALVDGKSVTYHRLGADLTSVTINIDKNAVYFKGVFGADKKLKELIDTYGIAVSLSGMPDERLTESHKTSYEGSTMANGETANGVSIINILKEDLTKSQNDNRGRDKIYATAYVTLTDGTTTFISDQSGTDSDDIAWSLYDAFNRLDELIDEDPTHFRRYTNDMRNYYEKWKNLGIKDWISEDTNFVAPEKDDVIDVLMIGSSSCYYYVEEMVALAHERNIKMRVCNVYYSGCPINKYYQDWLNNYADYQFFDTHIEVKDGEEVVKRDVLGGGKTLEWCLAQGDWDVISMQSRGALVMRDYLNGTNHLEADDIRKATEELFPYIREQFPDADFYLKEESAYQNGKVLTIPGVVDPADSPYTFDTLDKKREYAKAQKLTMEAMVEKFNKAPYELNVRLMRDGEAMMIVREGLDQWGGYDQLCARLHSKPSSPDISITGGDHEGDHGHVGDIGGGQYLEAALWLQTVMMNIGEELGGDPGFDIRESTWKPIYYDKNGNEVEILFEPEFLRAAAYKAATDGWTIPTN